MTKQIPLSQSKVALVDDQDHEWLGQWNWTYRSHRYTGYAYRNVYQKSQYVRHVYMHRAIMKPPPGMETDHINGDGLDNRRCNLRICTRDENMKNSRKRRVMTSRYKGVHWAKESGYWVARIGCNGSTTYLGCFNSEREAAIAYNEAARLLYGEFAHLNPVPNRAPVVPPARKQSGGTSQYVGVSWSRKEHCWRAEIRVNYKLIFLGHFDSEEEAAQAWNAAALLHRGARARLNDIPEPEEGEVTFGQRLKTLRAARGLTQKDLAELASTSHVFISHIERGKLLPSPDLKRRLREALRWGIYEDRAFEILECEAEAA